MDQKNFTDSQKTGYRLFQKLSKEINAGKRTYNSVALECSKCLDSTAGEFAFGLLKQRFVTKD